MNGRIALALVVCLGFMGLLALAMFVDIKPTAQRIVDGGIGALGTILAVAFNGIFRSDKTDEQRAQNTGAALSAISDAIAAQPPGTTGVAKGTVEDPLHVEGTFDDGKAKPV